MAIDWGTYTIGDYILLGLSVGILVLYEILFVVIFLLHPHRTTLWLNIEAKKYVTIASSARPFLLRSLLTCLEALDSWRPQDQGQRDPRRPNATKRHPCSDIFRHCLIDHWPLCPEVCQFFPTNTSFSYSPSVVSRCHQSTH